jgi:hypothetical protein
MKIFITESQIERIILMINEQESEEKILYLDKPVDFSNIKTISDLKDAVKSISLGYGSSTQSRTSHKEINVLLDKLDGIKQKDLFEQYFRILMNLIATYKTKSFTLKRLNQLLSSLLSLDENDMYNKMDAVIKIFNDDKFKVSDMKALIKLLLSGNNIDFNDFYNKAIKTYREYELSFAKGDDQKVFTEFFTSPRIEVEMKSNYNYGNVEFSKNEFNSQQTDVLKAKYLLLKLSQIKSFKPAEQIIEEVISNLKFTILFNFSDKNIKADLKQLKDLYYFNPKLMKTIVVGRQGEDVEVKRKPYDQVDFLSEFFKIDATKDNKEILVSTLSKMSNLKDPNQGFNIFMESLVSNFRRTLISTEQGDNIINHLTKNLSGMIFKDNVFIPISDINFQWGNVGYANKPRLSILYKVSDDPNIFKLESSGSGFSQSLKVIYLK